MLIRVLLVTINVLLGAQLVALATTPVEPMAVTAPGSTDPARKPAPPEAADAMRPGIVGYDRDHALSRPLFSPERRPWQPPVQAAAVEPEPVRLVEPEPEADFVLIGIGVARGQARALLTNGAGDRLGWVAEGETVHDWTVSAITGRSVTIARAEREVSLTLDPGSSLE
jgi:hypothetical protein